MSALPIRSKSSGIDICPARNPSLHTLRPEPASGDLDRNSARLPPPPLPPLPDPAGAEPSRAAPARQPSAQYPATHRCGHQRHRRRPTQATGQDQTLRPTPAHCLIGLPPKNKGAFQSTTTPQPYGSSFDWERLLNCWRVGVGITKFRADPIHGSVLRSGCHWLIKSAHRESTMSDRPATSSVHIISHPPLVMRRLQSPSSARFP